MAGASNTTRNFTRPSHLSAGEIERRRFRRFQVKFPVRELTPEQHITYATSVSAGGLFCPDACPRPDGSQVLLEIDLLGPGEPILAVARAVRSGGDGAGFGIAWSFVGPQPDLAAMLDRLGKGDA
ncbi:MAG: PilZ domain-containing protein [Myxococcota bacterium]